MDYFTFATTLAKLEAELLKRTNVNPEFDELLRAFQNEIYELEHEFAQSYFQEQENLK